MYALVQDGRREERREEWLHRVGQRGGGGGEGLGCVWLQVGCVWLQVGCVWLQVGCVWLQARAAWSPVASSTSTKRSSHGRSSNLHRCVISCLSSRQPNGARALVCGAPFGLYVGSARMVARCLILDVAACSAVAFSPTAPSTAPLCSSASLSRFRARRYEPLVVLCTVLLSAVFSPCRARGTAAVFSPNASAALLTAASSHGYAALGPQR